ncbi:MAG: transposase [Verrucomicrobia bacterium]|nr:transposase [Verrucomicrobiota bacterium]
MKASRPLGLWFPDEARFGRIYEGQRRCWAPFPQRPHAARQIVRQYVYAVAAVSPLDGRLCSVILPWMDAKTMAMVLRVTARTFATEHCVMCLDQAGWHTATAWRVPRSITLWKLPAHSPELNPVESLGKYIREHYFGQTVIPSLEAVEARLCNALRELDEQPEVVKSLCGYSWIQVISTGSPPSDSPAIQQEAPPTPSPGKLSL